MNAKAIVGMIGIVGATAGVVIIGVGTKDLGGEAALESVEISALSEAQRKDKVVRTKFGKLVRITHIEVAADATITAGTDLGDVVEVQPSDIPENALCNLIIDAEETTIKILYADPDPKGSRTRSYILGKCNRRIFEKGCCISKASS